MVSNGLTFVCGLSDNAFVEARASLLAVLPSCTNGFGVCAVFSAERLSGLDPPAHVRLVDFGDVLDSEPFLGHLLPIGVGHSERLDDQVADFPLPTRHLVDELRDLGSDFRVGLKLLTGNAWSSREGSRREPAERSAVSPRPGLGRRWNPMW